jgi:hypothetical protein
MAKCAKLGHPHFLKIDFVSMSTKLIFIVDNSFFGRCAVWGRTSYVPNFRPIVQKNENFRGQHTLNVCKVKTLYGSHQRYMTNATGSKYYSYPR